MDDEGFFVDKRRLINGDEMPAFLDFLTHNLKAIGLKGVPPGCTETYIIIPIPFIHFSKF